MKYKDSQDRFLTRALFWETSLGARREQYPPIYTLKDDDHEVDGTKYLSVRKLYMEIADPTEYDVAISLLGSWEHWKLLCSLDWFKPKVEQWREELEIKIRSDAIKQLRLSDKGNDQRWLAERGWQDKKVGRRTKEAIKQEAAKQERILDEVEADNKRMSEIHH